MPPRRKQPHPKKLSSPSPSPSAASSKRDAEVRKARAQLQNAKERYNIEWMGKRIPADLKVLRDKIAACEAKLEKLIGKNR